jgi:hypothetical protein
MIPDKCLTRDPDDNHYQKLLGTKIKNGHRRLTVLGLRARVLNPSRISYWTRVQEIVAKEQLLFIRHDDHLTG